MLAGLNEQDWDLLSDYFLSDDIPENAMDLFELHGFMTALAIVPKAVEFSRWWPEVMGEEDAPVEEPIAALLKTMLQGIHEELDSGEGIELPVELTPDDEEEGELLNSWCLGFVEGQMLEDETWFDEEVPRVAALSLPMAALAGAVEEEDLGELMKTEAARQQLAEQIPDCLDELFLLFREGKD
ncbi:MAG: YecA family protein [Gammaproteobacteria bacterium]|nr:YecA family protein [Gammaproteobacteria bacterium]